MAIGKRYYFWPFCLSGRLFAAHPTVMFYQHQCRVALNSDFPKCVPFFWIRAGFENCKFVIVPDTPGHVLMLGNVSCACWDHLGSACREVTVDTYNVQCVCVVLHVCGCWMSSLSVDHSEVWAYSMLRASQEHGTRCTCVAQCACSTISAGMHNLVKVGDGDEII